MEKDDSSSWTTTAVAAFGEMKKKAESKLPSVKKQATMALGEIKKQAAVALGEMKMKADPYADLEYNDEKFWEKIPTVKAAPPLTKKGHSNRFLNKDDLNMMNNNNLNDLLALMNLNENIMSEDDLQIQQSSKSKSRDTINRWRRDSIEKLSFAKVPANDPVVREKRLESIPSCRAGESHRKFIEGWSPEFYSIEGWSPEFYSPKETMEECAVAYPIVESAKRELFSCIDAFDDCGEAAPEAQETERKDMGTRPEQLVQVDEIADIHLEETRPEQLNRLQDFEPSFPDYYIQKWFVATLVPKGVDTASYLGRTDDVLRPEVVKARFSMLWKEYRPIFYEYVNCWLPNITSFQRQDGCTCREEKQILFSEQERKKILFSFGMNTSLLNESLIPTPLSEVLSSPTKAFHKGIFQQFHFVPDERVGYWWPDKLSEGIMDRSSIIKAGRLQYNEQHAALQALGNPVDKFSWEEVIKSTFKALNGNLGLNFNTGFSIYGQPTENSAVDLNKCLAALVSQGRLDPSFNDALTKQRVLFMDFGAGTGTCVTSLARPRNCDVLCIEFCRVRSLLALSNLININEIETGSYPFKVAYLPMDILRIESMHLPTYYEAAVVYLGDEAFNKELMDKISSLILEASVPVVVITDKEGRHAECKGYWDSKGFIYLDQSSWRKAGNCEKGRFFIYKRPDGVLQRWRSPDPRIEKELKTCCMGASEQQRKERYNDLVNQINTNQYGEALYGIGKRRPKGESPCPDLVTMKHCKNASCKECKRFYTHRASSVEVRDSKIHGKGLFATKAIGSGTFVQRILNSEHVTDDAKGCSIIDVEGAGKLDVKCGGDGQHVNHACKPNAKFQFFVTASGESKLSVFTTRDIEEGEEILIKYNSISFRRCRCPSCDSNTTTPPRTTRVIRKSARRRQTEVDESSKAPTSKNTRLSSKEKVPRLFSKAVTPSPSTKVGNNKFSTAETKKRKQIGSPQLADSDESVAGEDTRKRKQSLQPQLTPSRKIQTKKREIQKSRPTLASNAPAETPENAKFLILQGYRGDAESLEDLRSKKANYTDQLCWETARCLKIEENQPSVRVHAVSSLQSGTVTNSKYFHCMDVNDPTAIANLPDGFTNITYNWTWTYVEERSKINFDFFFKSLPVLIDKLSPGGNLVLPCEAMSYMVVYILTDLPQYQNRLTLVFLDDVEGKKNPLSNATKELCHSDRDLMNHDKLLLVDATKPYQVEFEKKLKDTYSRGYLQWLAPRIDDLFPNSIVPWTEFDDLLEEYQQGIRRLGGAKPLLVAIQKGVEDPSRNDSQQGASERRQSVRLSLPVPLRLGEKHTGFGLRMRQLFFDGSLPQELSTKLTKIETKCWDYRMYTFPLLTSEDINYFYNSMKTLPFVPSQVDKNGALERDNTRTSTVHTFMEETETIRRIKQRVMMLMSCSIDQLEKIQLVRYKPGEQFGLHHDLGDIEEEFTGGRWPKISLPEHDHLLKRRAATIFCYLNSIEEGKGGETEFPFYDGGRGKIFRPRKGRALLWSNITRSGYPNGRMVHRALPPLDSTKYGLNIWITET